MKKIAESNLNSIIVSWFFKRYSDYFTQKTKRIVSCDDNMSTELKTALSAHPQQLIDSIHNVIPKDVCEKLGVDDWRFIDNISGNDGSLTKAIAECRANIEELRKYADEPGNNGAIAAKKLIETLEEEDSISFLSSKGVLPKYGFPIDMVSLDIIGGTRRKQEKSTYLVISKLLSANLLLRQKIVANDKIWESYAINTVPDKGWPSYVYHERPACKRISTPDGNMIYVTTDIQLHDH